MTPLFSHIFCKIRNLLASRVERKRIEAIKKALKIYQQKRQVIFNNQITEEL